MHMNLSEEIRAQILRSQKCEITEYNIYLKLSESVKKKENSEVFRRIAEDERRHYEFWRRYTGKEMKPNRWKGTERLFSEAVRSVSQTADARANVSSTRK